MHHKYHKKSTGPLKSRVAASKSENGIHQSPPRQPRPNSSGRIELEAEPTPRETRPLAGTRTDPAPASTGEPEALRRGSERGKTWNFPPDRARLKSCRQLERRRGLRFGGFWRESKDIRVYVGRSWGFSPSLFSFFKDAMRKLSLPSLSTPPSDAALILGSKVAAPLSN